MRAVARVPCALAAIGILVTALAGAGSGEQGANLGREVSPPSDRRAQASAQPSFGETVSVGWVLVPVVVRHGSRYVEGLDREDFRLLVEDREVPIAGFERREDAPLSLLFVQDLSGSMAVADKLDHSREAVRFFLEGARPDDEYALASFADARVRVEVPLTSDLAALREAIAVWEAYGRTALHDAVSWIPRISVGGSGHLRRAVVVITDGVDNASRMGPAEARDRVRRAEIPVHVLGLGTGSPYSLSRSGGKVYRYADVLNLLAHMTGGRYYPVSGPYELKEACVAIVQELRHQYVLGFATRPDGPVGFHRIAVEVKGRERRVSFRRGYEGTAPQLAG